jgi:hypothetical protein
MADVAVMQQITGTAKQILERDISATNVAEAQQALQNLALDARKSDLRALNEEELIGRAATAESDLSKTKENLSKTQQELSDARQDLSRTQQEHSNTQRQFSATQQELSNTKGQLENLKKQLIPGGGRGVEAVPCWATPEGKPEYIFDVALTSHGLIIRDRKLPHRQAEQAALPLADLPFDVELSPDRFLAATRRLFEWSRAHECRFFVRAFDLTGETEKLIYKRHLRYLDTHFYKYEELNERFAESPAR